MRKTLTLIKKVYKEVSIDWIFYRFCDLSVKNLMMNKEKGENGTN